MVLTSDVASGSGLASYKPANNWRRVLDAADLSRSIHWLREHDFYAFVQRNCVRIIAAVNVRLIPERIKREVKFFKSFVRTHS